MRDTTNTLRYITKLHDKANAAFNEERSPNDLAGHLEVLDGHIAAFSQLKSAQFMTQAQLNNIISTVEIIDALQHHRGSDQLDDVLISILCHAIGVMTEQDQTHREHIPGIDRARTARRRILSRPAM